MPRLPTASPALLFGTSSRTVEIYEGPRARKLASIPTPGWPTERRRRVQSLAQRLYDRGVLLGYRP